MRNTYALINLEYLKNNIIDIRNNFPYQYYLGVIKAKAYGHGWDVIPTMEKAGINYFCVATLEEAIEARKYTKIPILCFGYINTKDINLVIKNHITLSIISYNYYQELKEINPKIKIHLKINSGMNRFGIKDKEELEMIINDHTNMEIEGIYTHLATSGVNDYYYDKQIKNFEEITSAIDLSKIKIVHLFNSLAVARHAKLKYANGVRLGLMMYGFTYRINESKFTKIKKKIFPKKISPTMLTNNLHLEKVLSLYSEVIQINHVKKGEFVGYRASFIAQNDTIIAIIPIGHADGITKVYKEVMINQKKYPIISICMDYIMVEIDNSVKVHDQVDILNNQLTISNIKEDSPHHVLVSISERVKRKYKE